MCRSPPVVPSSRPSSWGSVLRQPLIALVFYALIGVYFVLGTAGDSLFASDILNPAPLPDWWNNIWLPVLRLTYCITLWLSMYVNTGEFGDDD